VRQAHVDEAVSFQVIDAGTGDTARGDYPGIWTAPVRPLLRWTLTHARDEVARR
jgi:lipopolysaccharide transport system ATP-binding protein